MKKRVLSLFLASVMVLGMVACGSSDDKSTNASTSSTAKEESKTEESKTEESKTEEEGSYVNMDDWFPIVKEPITYTMSGPDTNTPDWENVDIINYFRDEMNIDFQGKYVDGDTWQTQFTLMLADDTLPDIIFGSNISMADIGKYGKDGYLLALDEYFDYMPNFKAFLEEHPDYKAVATSDDGHIYGLPSYSRNSIAKIYRTFISQKWLDNVGMEMPTTLDELYDVLKAFKEQDANGNGDPDDEIPVSMTYNRLYTFMHSFGMDAMDRYYAPTVKDGKVSFNQASDEYKAFLEFVAKLYDEGIIDPESFTQTDAELNAKVQADRIGLIQTGSAPYVMAGATIDFDKDWPALDGLVSEYNKEATFVMKSGITPAARIFVNADVESPEALCRLLDWLYTDEGSLGASKGVEGLTYEYQNVAYLEGAAIANSLNPNPDVYASAEEYRYKQGVINNGLNVLANYVGTGYEMLNNLSDADLAKEEVLVNQGWSCQVERAMRNSKVIEAFPTLTYTAEESTKLATLKTDISLYVEQALAQFMTGELTVEKDWSTYIANLEAMGLKDAMAIEQAAYDRAY